MTKVDLLVFGPHPDDIEIGFGGTVALHAARGFVVGLCDLTRGELSSNGTVEDRLAEAEAARAVLGADWRVNLGWPDGGPYETPDHVGDIVRLVRAAQPRVVAMPYWHDRHPDHRAASETLAVAVFKAGLRRVAPDTEHWKPERVCYYFINDDAPVSFGVDVSEVYDKKRQALACHGTQFAPTAPDSVQTRLTGSDFRQLIESRDARLGALTGVAYAEGVVVREPILHADLFGHRGNTGHRGDTEETRRGTAGRRGNTGHRGDTEETQRGTTGRRGNTGDRGNTEETQRGTTGHRGDTEETQRGTTGHRGDTEETQLGTAGHRGNTEETHGSEGRGPR